MFNAYFSSLQNFCFAFLFCLSFFYLTPSSSSTLRVVLAKIKELHEHYFGSLFVNNFPSFRNQIDPLADCQYVTVSRPGENKLPYYFRKMSGDFVCNVCGKQFGAKKTLSQHNWAVHTEFESNCTHCDKTFRSKKKLTYHMRSTHAENKVFHCDLKFGDIQCSYYLFHIKQQFESTREESV